MTKFLNLQITRNSATTGNTNDIIELNEDISELVECENKWKMNFNADKYSVMYFDSNKKKANYSIFNQQLSTTDHERILEIITPKDLNW